jgi:hypothetical protein
MFFCKKKLKKNNVTIAKKFYSSIEIYNFAQIFKPDLNIYVKEKKRQS